MAIISNFELYVKRIGPPGGIVPGVNDPLNAPFRKLLQGYYLTISNLSNREIRLRVRAVIPSLKSGSPFAASQRELVGGSSPNHYFAYDRTGDTAGAATPRERLSSLNLVPSLSKPEAKVFQSLNFDLDCQQTGLFNLVPLPSSAGLPDPQIEIRGYIELYLLDILRFKKVSNNPPIYAIEYIKAQPTDLLVTPEIRGTFIDNDFTGSQTVPLDFDQSNYALPTSTGSAKITVSDVISSFTGVEFPAPSPFPIPGPIPNGLGGRFGKKEEENIFVSDLVNIEKLTFTANSVGKFSLTEDSIKMFRKAVEKRGFSLKDLRQGIDTIEQEVNTYGILEDEKGK